MISLLTTLPLFAHFDVRSPARLVGNWVDVPALFGPPSYTVNAEVVLATTCPCSWLMPDAPKSAALLDSMLLLPDGICDASCTGALAACAANYHNASAILMSVYFNSPTSALPVHLSPLEAAQPPPYDVGATSLEPAKVAARTANLTLTANLIGCSSLVPTSYIESNWSSLLAAAANWSRTVLPAVQQGQPVTPASDVVAVAPGEAHINISIYRDPTTEISRDCSRVRMHACAELARTRAVPRTVGAAPSTPPRPAPLPPPALPSR